MLLFSMACQELAAQTAPDAGVWPWKTDTSIRMVELDEFRVMLGRDDIPPIDRPRFVRAEEALNRYLPDEPVIALSVGEQARAYPLSVLMWHELVNDQLADQFLCISFCPLCHSALVFKRKLTLRDGSVRLLDFGTSGMLRGSDLVMWDRQSQSWWQQFSGQALVGRLAGEVLVPFPSQLLTLTDFLERWPGAEVLDLPQNSQRPYGSNPYSGYDTDMDIPALFEGIPDRRLPAVERVIDLCLEGRPCRVYPFSILAEKLVVQEHLGEVPVVVFFSPGAKSVMDNAQIADSRAIGSASVFRAELDGKALHFEPEGEFFRDRESGSLWSISGQAIEGPLKGRQLEVLIHGQGFAFASFHFRPDSELYEEP